MAIPKDILAVQRPSSTVVKQRGTRFVVVKRTSKRVGNRVIPVDIGTVGEIIDGRFVERKSESPRQKTIDIKDYGEVALCNKHGKDLLDELAKVWDLNDAKRLYTIALLRAAYGDIKNRDLLLQYATSFASEIIPGVHPSEDAVSAFLQEIGQAYSMICSVFSSFAFQSGVYFVTLQSKSNIILNQPAYSGQTPDKAELSNLNATFRSGIIRLYE